MKKNHISFKDALTYNKYDNVEKRPKYFKDFDFRTIRIVPREFHDEKIHLKNIINPSGNYRREFYILSGYSGNGKTTFIHWFKEEVEKENFWFEVTNLIEHAHGTADDFVLVSRSIIHKYKNVLFKKETLKFMYDNRRFVRDCINNNILTGIVYELQKEDVIIDIDKSLDFLDQLDFKELLIAYVIDKIFDFKTKKYSKFKSFTFCFDNLDELRFEYLTPKMWNAILNLSSNLRYIIQNTNLTFDEKKIKFILVFREANIACGMAQINDRLSGETSTKRFIYTTIAKDIIEKRLKLVTRSYDDEDKRIKDLIEIVINEKILGYNILPLFNYDYRKLINALLDCIQPESKDGSLFRLFDYTKTKYDSIPHEDYKNLKRGILINTFIRYFARENYLSKLAPIREKNKEKAHCNLTRLMLTVFSSISFPDGFPIREKELAEIKPSPFSLLAAYKECKIFLPTPIAFFELLCPLIDLGKSSWAHLITVYNKQPKRENDTYVFDFSKEIKIIEKKEKGEITEKEKKYLDELSISLNSSAYIYLRHILPHFEYISGYKVSSGTDWYSLKPLILMTEITIEKYFVNGETRYTPCWEFQNQIKEVYEHVETYTHNNDKYFSEKLTALYDRKLDFCQKRNKLVFKGDFVNIDSFETHDPIVAEDDKLYKFFISRLITTHIDYIESFRHYITNEGYIFLEEQIKRTDKVTPILTGKDDIHKFILSYIKKYIDLLKNFGDPAIIDSLRKLETAHGRAVSDSKHWVRLKQPKKKYNKH